ncbi:S8 family serine peptidase [Dyadobacter sp. NIV53]|uniref:S8 family serine peptidase n=1 Tax=Dyadobacter sp. NIV53 TaxID=2861765 RepID=UPI001C876F66|nr:S8 family serine peptidase [Dyadobacter sp. NIV53]
MMKHFRPPVLPGFLLLVFIVVLSSVSLKAQRQIIARPQSTQKFDKPISGQYIVVYKNTDALNAPLTATSNYKERQQFMQKYANATLSKNNISGKKILQVYETALKGFVVNGLTSADVSQLGKDSQIAYIEPDRPVYLNETNSPEPLEIASGCSGPSVVFNGADHAAGLASFGSAAFVSGVAVIANTNGCTPISNAVSGKVAVIDRGTCSYVDKALSAQSSGAIAVIIVNNIAGEAPGMTGTNNAITIPVMSLSLADGNLLKAAIGSGVTEVSLDRRIPTATGPQCTPWGITRVAGGLPAITGRRAWIIDSGIDLTHPDLNVSTTFGAYFIGTSTNDQNGHGTHVAGIIGAKDNGFGVIGVAAGVEVVPVRVFPASGGSAYSVIIAGVNYAAAHAGPNDVVNMSLGGDPSFAIEDAVRNLSDICKVVLAAGNDAKNANFTSPARVNKANIYTVSAMDINGTLASFSNFGNSPVDFSAPGVNVASCFLNGTYAYLSGTSMATPHVTGILLLGSICGTTRVTGDPDGKPDLIAKVYDAADDVDKDGDTFSACSGDPDDFDATVYPGAAEICDGKDNNDDGQIDEGTVCCPEGNSGTLYVNAGATGSNTGTSWTNAFTTLQSAISAAKYCGQITQIWVAKGSYYPATDALDNTNPVDQRTKTFQMKNNLAIYGGFDGTEEPGYNLALRNFVTNETVLSGDIQQDDDFSNNVYNVVLNLPSSGESINASAVLDGFVILGGYADKLVNDELSFPSAYGGGIFNFGSDATITNCIFYSNIAYLGGAVENQSSNTELKNCWFLGNYALLYGGGMENQSSSPRLINCSFLQNGAEYGAGMINGGLSGPTLINCSFSGNGPNSAGGAMYNYASSTPIIRNSILWGNIQEIVSEAGSDAIVYYSIVEGGWSGPGSDNSSVDPRFVSQPVEGSSDIGDISLLACSPAINAGDPSTPSQIAGNLDLAGNNRFFGGGIDIGAYEFQGAPFQVSIAADPGLNINTGGSTTLTASGADAYLWSTMQTTAAITVTPAEATEYSVTGVSGTCSMVVTATVSVGPLPVSLISFSAKKQLNGSVKIDWVTANEVDNAHFILERSKDLKNIESIAKVNPDANAAATHSYNYTDELPYQGTSYYRLKQVDLNGHTTGYTWVSIVIDRTYAVFPNPVKNDQFQLSLDEPENAVLKFYSVDGHVAPLQIIRREAGLMELKLQKKSPPGVYLLKVEERGIIRNYRLVVE